MFFHMLSCGTPKKHPFKWHKEDFGIWNLHKKSFCDLIYLFSKSRLLSFKRTRQFLFQLLGFLCMGKLELFVNKETPSDISVVCFWLNEITKTLSPFAHFSDGLTGLPIAKQGGKFRNIVFISISNGLSTWNLHFEIYCTFVDYCLQTNFT